MKIELTPVGTIHSCYTNKFGIPRQPRLINSATATLKLTPPYNHPEAFRGLEQFSHVWIVFLFHASARNQWKATVRPPRLGGNERVGVFATRSNFRPNPIGLSVVELAKVEETQLQLKGGDFLDQTPVLDIKPYLPYVDSLPNASGGFAAHAPEPTNQVSFSPEALQAVREFESPERPALQQLISDMLSYNPRPAYHAASPDRIWGTSLFDLNVQWKQTEQTIEVLRVSQ